MSMTSNHLVVLPAFLLALVATFAVAEPTPSRVTFSKDVAPILYQACVGCHRPGEAAPMPLVTYREVRPWAKAIRDNVSKGTMPPWLADPRFGHFANDRRLSQKDIDTIVEWVNQGASKGADRDLPERPRFMEGWTLGEPDVILTMQKEFHVPEDGTIPYKYFTIPTNFTENQWIQAIECRPGVRSVVHHIIAFVQEPGKSFRGEGGRNNFLGGTAPGDPPNVYPEGTGKLIQAGSNIVLQMHYTPVGEAATDRSRVGLYLAKEPVTKQAMTGTAINASFVIPAGHPNYEVQSRWEATEDVHVLGLMPHMHVRGKDFLYTAIYPDGRSEVLLSVPRYDFNWQLSYELAEPLALPKGSRIECTAHFDNSDGNIFNPDPTSDVRWGDQTWEEMMIGWFSYTRDVEKIQAPPSTGEN